MKRLVFWQLLLLVTARPAGAALFQQTDVFVSGVGGYPSYRIPSVVTTPDGSLLAFAEGRPHSSDPGSGDIDILMRRSTDNGLTWSVATTAATNPLFGSGIYGDVSNPTTVVDHGTNTTWLFYNRWPPGKGESGVSAGNTDYNTTCTVWCKSSSDNGLTWSAERDISTSVKSPLWTFDTLGPGGGIQLQYSTAHPGRIILPINASPGGVGSANSGVFYSDDHGVTWQQGGLIPDGTGGLASTNECQAVELTSGQILLSCRQGSGTARGFSYSGNSGGTWTVPIAGGPSVTAVATSILRLSATRDGGDRDRILYAAPAGSGRGNLTVWTSYDEGQTFVNPRLIYGGAAAYCCLTKLNDGTVGLLYERDSYAEVTFARFDQAFLDAVTVLNWDGASGTANGAIDGGSGNWNTSTTNWTYGGGTANTAWDNSTAATAVFAATPGTVTVTSPVTASMLSLTAGYVLNGGGSNCISLASGSGTIEVTSGQAVIRPTTAGAVMIAGAANLVKSGNGVLLLGGSNSYSGTTTISAGVLKIDDNNALPSTSLVTVNVPFGLDLNGHDVGIRALAGSAIGSVNLGGSTLTISPTADTTMSGGVAGTGRIVKNGSRSEIFGGTNSFSGTYDVNSSLLVFTGSGSLAGVPNVNIQGDLTSGIVLGDVFASTTATIGNLSGGGLVRVDWNSATGPRTLSVKQTIDGTYAGRLTDSGSRYLALTKSGSGKLSLTASNADYVNGSLRGYSGRTSVLGGTLSISSDKNLGRLLAVAADQLTIGAATLEATETFSISSSRGITLTDSATIRVADGKTLTIPAVIAGSGSNARLTKSGPGTLLLSGSNTYSGGTFVNSGTLILTHADAFEDGTNLTVGASGRVVFDSALALHAPSAESPLQTVPEPGTLLLLAATGGIVAARRRRSWHLTT